MLKIWFSLSFLFSAKEISSVTILNFTKLALGKGLEERLLLTSVPPKENQNRLKTMYFLFLFTVTPHCIKKKTFQY